MTPYYDDGQVALYLGDCREVLPTLEAASIDAVVTDPPYELGFMGRAWDASGIAYDVEMWREVLRALKPGAHLVAFGGTRTYHRMACALEDAGLEVRDSLAWLYGSGFPKSMDVSKAIDKAAGATREATRGGIIAWDARGSSERARFDAPATDDAREWVGWGTALKPALEPIVLARKPFRNTVAGNVLAHGTGALNVDGCRIAGEPWVPHRAPGLARKFFTEGEAPVIDKAPHMAGRWPANVILGCACDDDEAHAPECAVAMLDAASGETAGVARFYYTAKASRAEREFGLGDLPEVRRSDGREKDIENPRLRTSARRNHHPTVKPVELMRWLVRLVTPPGGVVLDPFLGSGTTRIAAQREGKRFAGIEISEEYMEIAVRRAAQYGFEVAS